MNVSFAEAVKRGWIKKEEVPAASQAPGGLTPGQRAAGADAPASRLWAALKDLPDAVQEYPGAIPGRRYKIDVAFPGQRLCVEIDGWEWHGKHKGDFQRDRERQNLLTLNGWRILRFTAKDVRGDLAACVAQVELALAAGVMDARGESCN